ncbi:MAG: adenylosuccinate synthase [Bacteroidota bacterium]
MAVDVLLGLQWGDEGKGKVVDFLAPEYNVVARFQGGPNAGHTLEFDGIKHVLHQIPSGIFREDIRNVIGSGVVLDPITFRKEIQGLVQYGIDTRSNLFISKKAQLIIPTHRALDEAFERAKGEKKIGSTLKGIGPTYQDKVARQGLRVGDIIRDDFNEKYNKLREIHLDILKYYEFEVQLTELEKEFFESVDFMKEFALSETEYLVNDDIKASKNILAEGAQGSLLDVDFGSYPFVTSSNTMSFGACAGLGVAPKHIKEVFGIFKAYCTRVGSGPFPTELFDKDGQSIQDEGNEFGATTGRPRRCGWLDLPALKYAIMLNGVSQLFMMKVDVLSIFEEIKICTHYNLPDGSITDVFSSGIDDEHIEPVYKTFKGWKSNLDGISDVDDLPIELLEYVAFIEKEVGVPITLISTGPDRTQTIKKNLQIA